MPYVPPPVSPGKTALVAQSLMSGTVTPTAMGSVTIPANSAVVGTTYQVVAMGTIDNTATSPTFNFVLRLAGTTLATVTIASITAAATLKSFTIIGVLTFRTIGATGSVVGTLAVLNEAAGTIIGAVNIDAPAATKAANTTVGLVFDGASFLGAATAGNIVRTETAVIELVKA